VNPFAAKGVAPISPPRTTIGASVDTQRGASKPVNPFARKESSSAPVAVAPPPAATPVVIPQTPPPKRDDPSPFSPSAAISRGAPTIPEGLLPSPLVHNAGDLPDDDPYNFQAAPTVIDSLDSLNPFPKQETAAAATAAPTNYKIRGSQAPVTLGSLTAAAAVVSTATTEPAVPPPLPPVPPPVDDMALFAPSVPPPLASAFSPSLAAVPFDSFQPSSAADLEPPPPLPTPSSPPPPVPVFGIDSTYPVPAPLPPQDDYEDPLAVFSLPTATAVNPVDDDDLFGPGAGASSVPSFAAPPPARRAGGDSRPGPKSILDASNADAFSSGPVPAATAVPVNSRSAGAVRATATATTAGGARAGAGARSTAAAGRAAGPASSRGGGASRSADATSRLREHYSVAETEGQEGGDDGEYDLDLDPDRPRNIRTGRGGVASRGVERGGRGAGPSSGSGSIGARSSGASSNDVGYDEDEAGAGAGGEGELEMEGDVLARTDLYSLFSKEWKPHYWVVKGSFLLLYANIHDYEYNSGTAVRKKVPITHTMRCLKIKGKSYGGHGLLWNFMVEVRFSSFSSSLPSSPLLHFHSPPLPIHLSLLSSTGRARLRPRQCGQVRQPKQGLHRGAVLDAAQSRRGKEEGP